MTTAAAISASSKTAGDRIPWLFSPTVDLAAFGGSAAVSLALLALGAARGWLTSDTPEWTWITTVLLVDVAHVYATAFRTYFDVAEWRRRRWLYTLTPVLAWLLGAAVYSESRELFWRLLAYLAVFHFIRQQYGWVALYRTRGGERGKAGAWIDALAIYAATLYPLVYWHTHLPRQFGWFSLRGEFVALPEWCAAAMFPVYALALTAYAARSLWRGLSQGEWCPGKDLVVATTALCWYLGIVAFNSDYAFTVTNVVIHGVPYMVLVEWHRRRDRAAANPGRPSPLARWLPYLGALWLMAFVEELLWDRGVWHERAWLFGANWPLDLPAYVLVPLLTVPQLTHYLLDGFIWRRRTNPQVATWVETIESNYIAPRRS